MSAKNAEIEDLERQQAQCLQESNKLQQEHKESLEKKNQLYQRQNDLRLEVENLGVGDQFHEKRIESIQSLGYEIDKNHDRLKEVMDRIIAAYEQERAPGGRLKSLGAGKK